MFQTTNQTMIVVDNTMFLISGGWSFLVPTSAQLFFIDSPFSIGTNMTRNNV